MNIELTFIVVNSQTERSAEIDTLIHCYFSGQSFNFFCFVLMMILIRSLMTKGCSHSATAIAIYLSKIMG